MREGRPSTTATLVSFGRGVGLSARQRDPLATGLVGAPLSILLRCLDGPRHRAGVPRLLLRALSFGMVDHVALRMLAIDAALHDALATGIDQVVLLGAGLDARAFRDDALDGAAVYEVDHPATQAYKRARIAGLVLRARSLHFVDVDFSQEAFGERLVSAGFDPSRPTFWVWEGVTMYLPEAAVRDSLRELSRVSAPGSELVASYMLPRLVPIGWPVEPILHGVFRVLFGEALQSAFTPAQLAELLTSLGFEPRADSSSLDWAQRFGSARLAALLFRCERLVHAVRPG